MLPYGAKSHMGRYRYFSRLRLLGMRLGFTASGPLVGNTIEEMKRQYESQRDTEFAAHVCAEHPRKIDSKPK